MWGKKGIGKGECRRLHNEKIYYLHSSLNIIMVVKSRRMRQQGHVTNMGQRKGVYRVLMAEPEGKRPFGKLRCRWDDNIKIQCQEFGWVNGSIWLRIGTSGGFCECGNKPPGSTNCGKILD